MVIVIVAMSVTPSCSCVTSRGWHRARCAGQRGGWADQ